MFKKISYLIMGDTEDYNPADLEENRQRARKGMRDFERWLGEAHLYSVQNNYEALEALIKVFYSKIPLYLGDFDPKVKVRTRQSGYLANLPHQEANEFYEQLMCLKRCLPKSRYRLVLCNHK
ncbi:MAG: hypothetical protein CME61_00450 [Halobacteriovoraceae bacterium]|nr:hypothetical protein [Halobacteriovoraceae bacterium]|tara:strand:+ start:1323 stop:1688 length:366 start_codon:yes stop_codon:yes gene_type:complete